mmetsp:Transcript_22712/g.19733  ORF Transcript_22712/g.19733 Transcript_22712/m.19733 type:complete len:88 (-) Transcript_22712:145-408(-)
MQSPFVVAPAGETGNSVFIGCNTSGHNSVLIEEDEDGLSITVYENGNECRGSKIGRDEIKFGECYAYSSDLWAIYYYTAGGWILKSV